MLTVFAMIWAIIGMAAGVYAAAELIWPTLDFGEPRLSFGRLRTFHTNVVIFGFAVSALIATAFYSVQRTCHVPLFAPALAWFTGLAWQLIILVGGWSLLEGYTSAKEYAELEWPLDIAIAVAWVCFGIVFFGTIARRKIKPIYVSNWFYGALDPSGPANGPLDRISDALGGICGWRSGTRPGLPPGKSRSRPDLRNPLRRVSVFE